jgi:hypothetical protein
MVRSTTLDGGAMTGYVIIMGRGALVVKVLLLLITIFLISLSPFYLYMHLP